MLAVECERARRKRYRRDILYARTVAWIDDAFNDACHTWARERPSPTLLVETHPSRGLIAEHAALLKEWSRRHSSPA